MNSLSAKNPAETYEHYFVPAMFLPWANLLLEHAAPRPGENVLDVACGTGIVARQAAPMVGAEGQVSAVDINPAMLAVARMLPNPLGATINWHEGNAISLPFPDSTFDLVLCQHGLQFFPDRIGAIKEMRRVLKPGGRALVIVLQAVERHPVFEALMQSVARQLSLPLATVTIPFALSDGGELKGMFEAGGFNTVVILQESTTVRFPNPARFVPMAVMSSAAAVPAFAQLESPARASLLEAVRKETEPMVQQYLEDDVVTFPMYAHLAMATF